MGYRGGWYKGGTTIKEVLGYRRDWEKGGNGI